ncbi:MAG: ATP-binding protein [Pleurocapsa minor GSE-CHR-MK-17-07R]|jgi:DNA helicase HerA-like ATPase|nr:ATP-binding protein [Pleurocapsa minor GSE-CHR-MK 17-07R]
MTTNRPLSADAEFDTMIPASLAPAETIGVIVGGSLSKGLTVRLHPHVSVESLAVGRYVVVEGAAQQRFFCMVTDVILDNSNPDIQNNPPDITNIFFRDVYIGTSAYGKVSIQPMLSLESSAAHTVPKPVKTIPGHFTRVRNASVQDVNDVFGVDDAQHFNVGSPLEMERDNVSVNLNLSRLVERSIGVFGKSGTGKSFLTRLLLAGVIARDKASCLIFDMHGDYGGVVKDEKQGQAKGLVDILGRGRVKVCTLDPESSANRGVNRDMDVKLPYSAIEPADLEMLRETMNLSDAMIDAAYQLEKKFKDRWVQSLLDMRADGFDEFEADGNTRAGTLKALQRRLERFGRWDFLVEEAAEESIKTLMGFLEQGQSVVLEFGRYGNSLEAYILVANYLTRRIHEVYVQKMERALGDKSAPEPRQLLIVIEEAHKFLDPKIANQTIFGIIARELRKYNVTLLIVDQRPSGIDDEVMSQIGTRVTALLDNEKDISAVLNGISGAAGLREVLARLDTKQQAIIMGHAVPMPVVIKTREYGQQFYTDMQKLLSGDVLEGYTPSLNKDKSSRRL